VKRLPEVDVVIVGAGWTGLLMAKELVTRSALKVTVLERGASHQAREYVDGMDELDYGLRVKMMQDISQETITFRHAAGDRALPVRQYGSFLPGSGVGGSGEHWSGISYRYTPDAFDLHTRTVEKYGAKRLPEDHSIQDWGIGYDELEPYYTRAEKMMGISGKAGNLKGKIVPGGNVFEGPRSEEFPTPPMKMPYLASLFKDATGRMGYHPFPLPAATTSQAYRNPDGVSRAGCTYCGYCERFGCMIGAKSQPTNTLLPVLRGRKNFDLRTHCWVKRIQSEGAGGTGRATGVVYVDAQGEEVLQPAGMVFLCSWTLNNSRLLLLSKIGTPYDPATGQGTLGRNLTHHISIPAATAYFPKPLNRFMGAGSAGIAINDFDADAFDHSQVDFLRGGSIYTVCYGFRPMANFGVLPASVKTGWGSEWKKAAMHHYDRTGRLSLYGEHLAYKGNYMDLDPIYKDCHGDPLLRFTLDWRDNERRMAAFMSRKATEIAKEMGATEVTPFPGLKHYDVLRYQSTHIQGGAIMGANESNSVVNNYQQHWQTPNLFVVGASSFPQNPSGNPTLTALALTYRTADAILDRFVKAPGPLA
jgi:gluconate 2-dehydrogenase alpha chain